MDSSADEEELISTGNDGALRGDGGRRASRCDGLSNLRRFSTCVVNQFKKHMGKNRGEGGEIELKLGVTCLRDEKKLECRDIDGGGGGGGGGGGIFSPMKLRQCLGWPIHTMRGKAI